MNNPLDRKMFRQAGMSKQPMGILASSPELMGAVKGYQQGGLNAIPILGSKKFNVARSVQPNAMNTLGSPFQDNIGVQIQNETPLEVLKKEQEIRNKNIEPNVVKNSNINNINKNILDSENLEYPKGSNLNIRGKTNKFEGEEKETSDIKAENKKDVSADNIVDDYKEKVDSEIEAINTATKKIANGMANTSEMKFFNTSYDKENKKLIDALKKENKEPTFADVKDIALELGYKDPKTLDGEYSEAKEASIWLNMMKAGLAMASGESSNAMTNIAKGFAFGLDGYGKDIGKLSDDLKEDKKEYSKTMFGLLKDERSRRLAENALEIQKQSAITTILKEKSGEERDILIKQAEMEIANRKMTINLYKSFADLGFEKLKFNVGREDVANATKLAYQKMQPDSLKLLIASGDVKIIDPSKPFSVDNLETTPLGKKKIDMLITQSLSGKVTDTDKFITSMGASGSVEGLTIPDFDPNNSTQVTKMGQLRKLISSANHPFSVAIKDSNYLAAGNALMTEAVNSGIKISISKLNPSIKEALKKANKLGDPIFTD